MELTRGRNIPQHDYTSQDLADDLSDLERIKNDLSRPGFPR